MENSIYSKILGKLVVSRSNLAHSLDVISLPLEFSSVKHLCDLMGVEKITKIIVREFIDKIVAKKNRGNKNYLLD